MVCQQHQQQEPTHSDRTTCQEGMMHTDLIQSTLPNRFYVSDGGGGNDDDDAIRTARN